MNYKNFFSYIKNIIIIIFLIYSNYSHSLILEDLVAENKLLELFENKKICYYPGSFNLLHKGHENIVYSVIQKKLCNYVIIYPLWGGDSYKKRLNLEIRQEMLFVTFQEHPNVIVSKLSPEYLQKTFTDPAALNIVKPKYNIEFIGIVGSDNALQTWKKPSNDFSWLGNLKIPDIYKEHTLGTLMALPANKLIIFVRNGDDMTGVGNTLNDKEIIAIIKDPETYYISSSLINELYKKSPDLIKTLVNEKIFKIFEQNIRRN